MTRRRWVAAAAFAGLPMAARSDSPVARAIGGDPFLAALKHRMSAAHVPGLSLTVVENGRPSSSLGLGWADLERRAPMTPATVLNTASVTKTITCTAIMQLWEAGRMQLDAPVGDVLPFDVRNPSHRTTLITVRQLLTHTSSIADAPAYGASYACGDSSIDLKEWLAARFDATGAALGDSFHPWAPGQRHSYSNVAFGLLGLVVEQVSSVSFERYCHLNVLRPLGMARSGFRMADLDGASHATPYEHVEKGQDARLGFLHRAKVPHLDEAGEQQFPLCPYSFAIQADGLLRSSTDDMARFARAFLNRGPGEGKSLLKDATTREILRNQLPNLQIPGGFEQGLAWRALGGGVWAHMGRDPGVAAALAIRRSDGRAVALLANGSRARPLLGALVTELMALPA